MAKRAAQPPKGTAARTRKASKPQLPKGSVTDDRPVQTGRPPSLVLSDDLLKTINGLASIQCTLDEAAAVLQVSKSTIIRFKNANPDVEKAWQDGILGGKASLRRDQFALAKRSAAMAIFLGKNLLGQRDRFEHDHRDIAGDLSRLTPHELEQFEALLDKLTTAPAVEPDGGAAADAAVAPAGGEGPTHH